jgi:hypothetical protein
LFKYKCCLQDLFYGNEMHGEHNLSIRSFRTPIWLRAITGKNLTMSWWPLVLCQQLVMPQADAAGATMVCAICYTRLMPAPMLQLRFSYNELICATTDEKTVPQFHGLYQFGNRCRPYQLGSHKLWLETTQINSHASSDHARLAWLLLKIMPASYECALPK